MDPIKAQKVRAMNLYKKSDPFFQSLILHSLLALACSLFCSYSYSFPNSFYTIKHLLFDSLPNTWSGLVNPGCLFVVVNCIVVFLIGESRISGKESSSPVEQVYDEYVARTRSLRRRPSTTALQGVKKEEKIVVTRDGQEEDNANGIEDCKEVNEFEVQQKEDEKTMLKEESGDQDEDFEECEEDVIGNEKEEEEEEEEREMEEHDEPEEQDKEEEEEAVGIQAEELNKRVEDFIARVNKQRWLEARFFVCSTRA